MKKVTRGRCEGVHRVVELAEELGFSCASTSRGHIKFTRPATTTVFFSGAPHDWRAIKNGIAQLRRAVRDSGQDAR